VVTTRAIAFFRVNPTNARKPMARSMRFEGSGVATSPVARSITATREDANVLIAREINTHRLAVEV